MCALLDARLCASTWDILDRGSECRVISDPAGHWSGCDPGADCGNCVQACPTGILVKQGTSTGEMIKLHAYFPSWPHGDRTDGHDRPKRGHHRHHRMLIRHGDCAVTGRVPAIRNRFELSTPMGWSYRKTLTDKRAVSTISVSDRFPQMRPVHGWGNANLLVPGSPHRADATRYLLCELIADRTLDPSEVTRLGA